MPVYEYRCDKCGDETERLEKFSDPPVELNCAKCTKGKFERQLGVPGLKFKGSGFYVNDYGRSSKS
jgi:putative FmdB family regulatory protein